VNVVESNIVSSINRASCVRDSFGLISPALTVKKRKAYYSLGIVLRTLGEFNDAVDNGVSEILTGN